MAYKGPLDYIDVATRTVEFREKYPEGSLSRVAPDGSVVPVEFREFGNKSWVVYTAFAYRSPDDKLPGVGTAWEPVPGPTQFTRDSELQNAETAAWGRAMVAALAVDTRKGIASAEEVRNRQGVSDVPAPVDEAVVAEWVAALGSAVDMNDLQGAWSAAGKAGVARDPRVVAAKDARKKELAGG